MPSDHPISRPQIPRKSHKKNVLVLRGRFRPPTLVNLDMLHVTRKQFEKEPDVTASNVIEISELTLHDLSPDGEIDEEDFLHRAKILCSLGQNVLVSNYFEHYRLVNYLSKITQGQKIGIAMGIHALAKVFEEKTYEDLRGGILECFASLFGSNVKIYVYPAWRPGTQELLRLKDFEAELPANLKSLFRFLIDNDKLADVPDANVEHLHIVSDDVLKMIRQGDPRWEPCVPPKVLAAVKQHGLFDYRPGKTSSD